MVEKENKKLEYESQENRGRGLSKNVFHLVKC